ncbi:MAG: polyphosphate polymerase domain-containing protein [Lachnospiraceae bacterium]|nr:polyphosphate polymerase domain-containing protein [Lachnospiraceae bacterium]
MKKERTKPKSRNSDTKRFRHEWKYMITEAEKDDIKRRLDYLLKKDSHTIDQEYAIRSLYFDDYWDSSYDDKIMGCDLRKKYRIRIYNYSDTRILLERKCKVGNYIYKESARLTKEEFERIMEGEYRFLEFSEQQLLREFYVECMCRLFRPKVIVDYEREPYVMEEGTVRITFDKRLRAAVGWDIFDAALPTLSVFPPEQLVLEVKYTEFLPKLLQQVLPTANAEFMAVSKYALCYEKRQYLQNESCWCQ